MHSDAYVRASTKLPLRANEDKEHDSLDLEPQPGCYDKFEQSTKVDEFSSSNITEDSFQFKVPSKDSPFNNIYQAPSCDLYSPVTSQDWHEVNGSRAL